MKRKTDVGKRRRRRRSVAGHEERPATYCTSTSGIVNSTTERRGGEGRGLPRTKDENLKNEGGAAAD